MMFNWIVAGCSAIVFSYGLLLIIGSLSSGRSFARRLTPWVADVSGEAADYVTRNVRLDDVWRMGLRRALARLFIRRSPSTSTQLMLRQAGVTQDSSTWAIMMVEASLIGGLIGAGIGVAVAATGKVNWAASASLVLLGLASGVLVRRLALRRKAAKRVARILDELPVIIDLFSLSLAAGETVRDALQRVSTRGLGPLSDELREVQAATDLGQPLTEALRSMTRALSISTLTRTFDHIVTGIERGTPLAKVMRTQAQEARAEAARSIQERASSREVVLLIPLIFLILPVTIAFAIFPGLLVIQAGI